jgi:hypothetical protein
MTAAPGSPPDAGSHVEPAQYRKIERLMSETGNPGERMKRPQEV